MFERKSGKDFFAIHGNCGMSIRLSEIMDLFLEYAFRDDVFTNITNAKYSTYIGVAILVVVLVVSPIIIFLVRNATNTIQVGFDFDIYL